MTATGLTTIGLVGSGHIGSQLARLAVAHGYDVVVSNSRGPETLAADSQPKEQIPILSDDAWDDAYFMMETSENTLDEIAQHLAFQDRIDKMLDPIIEENPETCAPSGFDSNESAYIQFTGTVPHDVTAQLSTYPEVDVRGGAALSEVAADALNVEITTSIKEIPPLGAVATSRVDPETGKAFVSVSDSTIE